MLMESRKFDAVAMKRCIEIWRIEKECVILHEIQGEYADCYGSSWIKWTNLAACNHYKQC